MYKCVKTKNSKLVTYNSALKGTGATGYMPWVAEYQGRHPHHVMTT